MHANRALIGNPNILCILILADSVWPPKKKQLQQPQMLTRYLFSSSSAVVCHSYPHTKPPKKNCWFMHAHVCFHTLLSFFNILCYILRKRKIRICFYYYRWGLCSYSILGCSADCVTLTTIRHSFSRSEHRNPIFDTDAELSALRFGKVPQRMQCTMTPMTFINIYVINTCRAYHNKCCAFSRDGKAAPRTMHTKPSSLDKCVNDNK